MRCIKIKNGEVLAENNKPSLLFKELKKLTGDHGIAMKYYEQTQQDAFIIKHQYLPKDANNEPLLPKNLSYKTWPANIEDIFYSLRGNSVIETKQETVLTPEPTTFEPEITVQDKPLSEDIKVNGQSLSQVEIDYLVSGLHYYFITELVKDENIPTLVRGEDTGKIDYNKFRKDMAVRMLTHLEDNMDNYELPKLERLLDIVKETTGWAYNAASDTATDTGNTKSYNNLVGLHREYIKSYGLKEKERIDEQKEEDTLEENQIARNKNFSETSYKVDPTRSMSYKFKVLLSAAQAHSAQGTPLYDQEFGLPIPSDPSDLFNRLAPRLTKIPQGRFDLQMELLEELGTKRPEFKKLHELMQNINSINEEYNFSKQLLQQEFNKVFSQTRPEFGRVIVDNKVIKYQNADKETLREIVKTTWSTDFKKLVTHPEFAKAVNSADANLKRSDINDVTILSAVAESIGFKFNEKTIETLKTNKKLKAQVIESLKWIVKLQLSKPNLREDLFAKGSKVGKRVNQLADIEAENSDHIVSNQHLGNDKKPTYSLTMNTQLSFMENELNAWKNTPEADRDAYLEEHMPWYLEDKFGQNSFIRDQLEKNDNSELTWGIIESVGDKDVSDADPGEITTTKIKLILENKIPFVTAGDRSSFYFWSVGERLHSPKDLELYLYNHLLAEIAQAQNQDLTGIQHITKQAGKLRIMPGFIGERNTQRIEAAVKAGTVNILMSDKIFDKEITSAIRQEINKMIADEQAFMTKHGLFDKIGETYPDLPLEKFNQVGDENNKDDKNKPEEVATLYIINSVLGNIEAMKLFLGDPGIYKSTTEAFKRWKLFNATKYTARHDKAGNVWMEKHLPMVRDKNKRDTKTPVVKVGIIQDYKHTNTEFIKVLEKLYSEQVTEDLAKLGIKDEKLVKERTESFIKAYVDIKGTDSQGWVTIDEYRWILWRNGLWGVKHEAAFQKMVVEKQPLTADEFMMFQPLKTQYAGPLAGYNHYIPTTLKHSLMPLIPHVVENFPALKDLMERMEEEGVGIMQTESGVKFGATLNDKGEIDQMFDGELFNTSFSSLNTIYSKYLGVQQIIDSRGSEEDSVTDGVQKRRLLGQDIFTNGVPLDTDLSFEQWSALEEGKKRSKSPLYNTIQKFHKVQNEVFKLQQQEFEREAGIEEIPDQFGDPEYMVNNREKFVDYLWQIFNKTEVSKNIKDSAEELLDHQTLMDGTMGKIRMESLLINRLRKALANEQKFGASKVLTAPAGFKQTTLDPEKAKKELEKKGVNYPMPDLKFYRADPKTGKTLPAQILLPHSFRQYFKTKGEIPQVLKEFIGFRIPSTGLASVEYLEVLDFLPPEAGDMVVIPMELIAKSNADFDIDKMPIIFPNYDIVDDKQEYISHKEEITSQTKPSRVVKILQNKLLKYSIDLVSHPKRFITLVTPVGKGIIHDIATARGVTEDKQPKLSFTDLVKPSVHTQKYIEFQRSGTLISVLSVHTTQQPFRQKENIYINRSTDQIFIPFDYNKVTINTKTYPAVGGILDQSANRISNSYTEATQHALDAVNDAILEKMNINPKTVNVVTYLIALGVNPEDIINLVTSPAVSEYITQIYTWGRETRKDKPKSRNKIALEIGNKYGAGFTKGMKNTIAYYARKGMLTEMNKRATRLKEYIKSPGAQLETYIELDRQAQLFNSFTLDARIDSDPIGGNTRFALYSKIEKMTNGDWVTANFIGNAQGLFQNTFLKSIKDGMFRSDTMFKNLMLTELPHIKPAIKAIQLAAKLPAYASGNYAALNSVDSFVENAFIAYALMMTDMSTGSNPNETTRFSTKNKANIDMFFGEKNLTTELKEIFGVLPLDDPRIKLRQNALIKHLIPHTKDGQAVIQPFQRIVQTTKANQLIDAWNEIFTLTPDLGKKLMIHTIMQSGIGPNFYSYTPFIPAKIYNQQVQPILQRIRSSQVVAEKLLDSFKEDFFLANPDYILYDSGYKGNDNYDTNNISFNFEYKSDNEVKALEKVIFIKSGSKDRPKFLRKTFIDKTRASFSYDPSLKQIGSRTFLGYGYENPVTPQKDIDPKTISDKAIDDTIEKCK